MTAELVSGTPPSADRAAPLTVGPDCVRLLSVMPGDGGGIRLRLENLSGEDVNAEIELPRPIGEAWTEDLLGHPEAPIPPIYGTRLTVPLRPYALTTVAVSQSA